MFRLLVISVSLLSNFLFRAQAFVFFHISPHNDPKPLDGRIVGGINADIKNYPYQLSLEYSGQHICGASILSHKYAVTASHCTNGASPDLLTVRSGTTFRGNGGVVTKIKTICQHPNFNIRTVDYDVSILRLSNDLTIGDLSKPIFLINEEVKEGAMATVTGWGSTKENGQLPKTLQVLQIPIVSRIRCRIIYGLFNRVTERMLCAGNISGGKDTCQGDSGGPLVVNGKLTGIVSWGYGCARPYFPGVYTNVFDKDIRKFIKDITAL